MIGHPLSHSFSKNYFSQKFEKENIQDSAYELYPIPSIEDFPELLNHIGNELVGLNVTIPYKQAVIPYLDQMDPAAFAIGAINTIHFGPEGKTGYNTDAIGFETSLLEVIDKPVSRALILGNGGAAKAVKYVLKKLGIEFRIVSRIPSSDTLSYDSITDELLIDSQLIINTTPLGMYPQEDRYPPLNYDLLGPNHILYDLIYNPPQTIFLAQGAKRSCKVINGLDMLYRQAEASWKIWNS